MKSIYVSDVTENLAKIEADLHIIAIDTDLLFTAQRNLDTYKKLKEKKENVFYHEIKTTHGHDAFLMEYEQLEKVLQPIF